MKLSANSLPRHIGIIMDGNGRWAAKRLLPRPAGHRAGVKTLGRIMRYVFKRGIPYLTVYAFSTENTARPEAEVKGLIDLIRRYFEKELPSLIKNGIRVRAIGDKTYFSDEIQAVIATAEAETARFTERNFIIALNYGARSEIVRAANRAVQSGKAVTEAEFSALLDTADVPDPDMIIRTGGEQRLSNFLLYQAAYAELFFVPDLWPDFDEKRLCGLLEENGRRNRRFGK